MASGRTHRPHSVGTPMPEDGQVLESVGPRDWRPRASWARDFAHAAETSFVLPVGSRELFLVGRGAYQAGRVVVIQSSKHGDVKVSVRVAYKHERALARATVCRLRKTGAEQRDGVGIFTPSQPVSHDDQLLFDVVITFPAAPSGGLPLRIPQFTVLTGNFALEMADLWESMLFENIKLCTSNSPICAKSITLTKGSLISSNGAITGHFNTADALSLKTTNGAIQATVALLNNGQDPAKLYMDTTNAQVAASVSLGTQSGTGGRFFVKAHSVNGAVKLKYDDAPPSSRLRSEAATTNAPVTVGMHPTFEGAYEVLTSNSRPAVYDTHPTDPTGSGRRRVVEQCADRCSIRGRVYWARMGNEGSCKVHTTNGPASLDL